MPRVLLIFLTMGLFLLASAASAMAQNIPELNADDIRKRLGEPGFVVVDTRTNQEYLRGHITGAINISSQESRMYRDIARFLPQDKNTSLVFYCRGETCSLAPDAAMAAFRAGYRHVYTYRGGYPDWQQKGLPITKP